MNVTINIHPTEATPEGFAGVDLRLDDGSKLCTLDLQYSVLARLPNANPVAIDFLLIASAVYAIDKLFIRESSVDAWTRSISLDCPVSDLPRWDAVRERLSRCLSFLTGDIWTIHFSQRTSDPVRPQTPKRFRKVTPFNEPLSGDTVSLFSGGLDSLTGVIDWLESNHGQSLLLVGHHESDMAGPFGDQKNLLTPLLAQYSGRIRCMLARVGHTDEASEATEITLRGRSLIFVALGIFAASALGPTVPLLVPENGTIALNVPLTPSRRGSCNTRTAHPRYLLMLAEVLATVGLANPISNPLRLKTKGEVLRDCRNQQVLNQTARKAISCAKRGHKVHWTRRAATSCGRCMPCIYRRAAMHVLGWDTVLTQLSCSTPWYRTTFRANYKGRPPLTGRQPWTIIHGHLPEPWVKQAKCGGTNYELLRPEKAGVSADNRKHEQQTHPATPGALRCGATPCVRTAEV